MHNYTAYDVLGIMHYQILLRCTKPAYLASCQAFIPYSELINCLIIVVSSKRWPFFIIAISSLLKRTEISPSVTCLHMRCKGLFMSVLACMYACVYVTNLVTCHLVT